MMTETTEGVTGFVCPPWCTEHERSDGGRVTVRHSRPVRLAFPDNTRPRGRVIEVAAEVWDDEARGRRALVYLNDDADGELHTAAEVQALVDALLDASRQAFGDPIRDVRAEVDDALFEVVERAARPEGGWTKADADRLMSAAVRLRNAHKALVEVTS